MRSNMKKIIGTLIILLIFSIGVSAQSLEERVKVLEENQKKIVELQYKTSVFVEKLEANQSQIIETQQKTIETMNELLERTLDKLLEIYGYEEVK